MNCQLQARLFYFHAPSPITIEGGPVFSICKAVAFIGDGLQLRDKDTSVYKEDFVHNDCDDTYTESFGWITK